jgi:hypothetical protein
MYPQRYMVLASKESGMNIFKSNGQIDASIDPLEIPDDRRGAFTALVAAQAACEQTEADEKVANDAVAEAVKVHDRASAAVPRSTFLQEHRAAVAAWGREH